MDSTLCARSPTTDRRIGRLPEEAAKKLAADLELQ
jgi:hypothetical protein